MDDISIKIKDLRANLIESPNPRLALPMVLLRGKRPFFPGLGFSDPRQGVKTGPRARHVASIVSAENPLKAALWAALPLPAGAAKRGYQAQEARRREGSAAASPPQSWPTEGIGGP